MKILEILFGNKKYKKEIMEKTFAKSRPVKAKNRNKSKDFLNNNDMLEQVLLSQQLGVCTPELMKMFEKLSERIHRKFYFENVDLDALLERQHCGVIRCWQYYNKFDIEKSRNPFAFFTQCIKMESFQTYRHQQKWMRGFKKEDETIKNSKDLFVNIEFFNENGADSLWNF